MTVADRADPLYSCAVPRPALHVQLDSELPKELATGAGTAVFVCGWCFSPQAPVRELIFLVDGEPHPLAAQRMPRLDPFRAMHPTLDVYGTEDLTTDPGSADDPLLLSYRSGFWGTVPIVRPPARGGRWLVELQAELADGTEAVAVLAEIASAPAVEPLPAPAVEPLPARESGRTADERLPGTPAGAAQPLVAIAMATHDPPPDLLARQIESIRAQTHRRWVCVISDDCSSDAGMATLRSQIAGDPRFVLSRSPARLGFYRNFERALALVPCEAELVAMADQDDAWHPHKLATLVAELGSAQLVYSDARVVSRDGELISETWWSRRRNNHSDLLSLLVANAVTGAASLFRRSLLEVALPFPPAQFAHFHDHWVALTALALGEIAFVERPLYDYVQHGDAALGHAAANQMISLGDRVRHQRDVHERVRMWRLHYFVDVCRLIQFVTVLQLRCASQMAPAKRRILRRFIDADRRLAPMSTLALRGGRELAARQTETLGAEWMLAHAFAWRRLVEASARERPQRRFRLDAVPPSTLVQHPGRRDGPESVRSVADKIAPLRWAVSASAPTRVNILIPTIDLQHLFGGYIAKFNLARRLADRGARVRIVTVDPVAALPPDWVRQTEAFGGLSGLFDRVELVFGRESAGIELSRHDSFVATTWWTAHIANAALDAVDADRFLYLIQEYEPFTFPMGTYAALAEQSYQLPHVALFSSELLRGFFRGRRLGVFANGADGGENDSASFQNAITAVDPPEEAELTARRTRRLLFYARPEPHAARNMFELGMLALERALHDGLFRDGWELNGIGTTAPGRRLTLAGGHLNLLPRVDQAAYADMLRGHDIGLALMYTPHPSLVPLEMCAAGMLTVTNSFENKTVDALEAISRNLIVAEPSIEALAAALRQAASEVSDHQRRVRGAAVAWCRDWSVSFPDELLDCLLASVGAPTANSRAGRATSLAGRVGRAL